MALYPYQQRVKALVRSGKSVILQAPTGAGKTRAALAPYIEAFFEGSPETFPRKCIYSVPMRVLANQFYAEYSELTATYFRRTRKEMRTAIQTGDEPQDPKLLKDMIFATIDQSLSSALAVPYSLSAGMANLNAGAFYASYLVFDEFHLFPSDEAGTEGALTTTLQLLMQLKGITPFVLMTATFSSTMLGELARLLDAEVVQVPFDEYQMIAAGTVGKVRSRRYLVHDEPLSAEAVLAEHQSRSIIICNQVKRAQELLQALQGATAGSLTKVALLHSRFTAEDRRAKETYIRREFGKDPTQWTEGSLILVATQVIEVGLDITCEQLHTEIAPANAIFQRAGRCARYPGEQGVVHLYAVPTRETTAGVALADYLPYPRQLCESAWASFQQRDGEILDFTHEQQVIDEVHTEADRQLLAAMQRQGAMIWEDIYAAMQEGAREQRANLIRRIDNITLLAAPTPDAVGNPYTAQGFGLWRGTVKGLWKTLTEFAQGWSPDEDDEGWLMKFPVPNTANPDDPTEPVTFTWVEVTDPALLDSTALVVVNRAFCAYDNQLGFRIVPPEKGGWSSQPGEYRKRNSQGGFAYELESYTDHIGQMLKVYRRDFAQDYAYIQRRVADKWDLPPDGLARAIRLAIALHDLAKMDKRWQRWVRLYQQSIGEAIGDDQYMAVHTHWSPAFDQHKGAKKQADRQCKRPPHAGESAIAGARIVAELCGHNSLGRAILTAITRHHSAQAHSFGDYELHPAAQKAMLQALALAELPTPTRELFTQTPPTKLETHLVQAKNFQEVLLYLWIVRILRLSDGLSQEE
jgi:CRISPR-associated endonuclease/helicase Cas3